MHFSCAADPAMADHIGGISRSGRNQLVICGIEAHVCVTQTALGFKAMGLAVTVIADAVTSRRPESVRTATDRLSAAGVTLAVRVRRADEGWRAIVAEANRSLALLAAMIATGLVASAGLTVVMARSTDDVSKLLVFANKQVNSSGLQLADLVARPIGLSVLRPGQTNRAFEALRRKFFCSGERSKVGEGFENWGLKIYPSPESEKPR